MDSNCQLCNDHYHLSNGIFNSEYTVPRNTLDTLKLDELIKGVEGSRTSLVGLEKLPDHELDRLQDEFKHLHHREKSADEHSPQSKSSTIGLL